MGFCSVITGVLISLVIFKVRRLKYFILAERCSSWLRLAFLSTTEVVTTTPLSPVSSALKFCWVSQEVFSHTQHKLPSKPQQSTNMLPSSPVSTLQVTTSAPHSATASRAPSGRKHSTRSSKTDWLSPETRLWPLASTEVRSCLLLNILLERTRGLRLSIVISMCRDC